MNGFANDNERLLMVDVPSVGGSADFVSAARRQDQALRELASGQRVNRAADAAAALAISTVLESDRGVLAQAATNVAQGASLAQVAEGGLRQIGEGLTRLRELAAKAQSGALDETGRRAVDSEFQQIREEITAIAQETRFNGESLLDNGDSRRFQAGPEAGDSIELQNSDATAAGLGIEGLETLTLEDAAAALAAVDGAIDQVAEARADLGGSIGRFEQRGQAIASQQEALSAANSSLVDADLAGALSRSLAEGIRAEGEAFARAQANQGLQLALGVL